MTNIDRLIIYTALSAIIMTIMPHPEATFAGAYNIGAVALLVWGILRSTRDAIHSQ